MLWTGQSQATNGLAIGWGELPYAPPPSGSYQLPPLGIAGNGVVLDEDGNPQNLQHILQGKYSLLSFIYSHCQDQNGCPLSNHVMYRIKATMQQSPRLALNLRLVSVSFDPQRDTPAAMRRYSQGFQYAGPKGEWRFLTTASNTELQPILDAYQQQVQRRVSLQQGSGEYAHLLRVFLIDPMLRIRNIYSVQFLHPDLILNDLETLFLQADNAALSTLVTTASMGPGDVKTGYEYQTYTTQSRALAQRQEQGRPFGLWKNIQSPPLGLPPVTAHESITAAQVNLGRQLFFDRRLSLNKTISCGMCHIPEQGFSSNEMATAVGFEGRSVRRNTPSLYNVAHVKRLFHDGRDHSLIEQIWSPLLARNEMANPSVGYVLATIRGLDDYQGAFEQAFGKPVDMVVLGAALAAYQKSLVSADSAFDRWYFGQQQNALSAQAQAGFTLFRGKANCVQCHRIAADHALFTDHDLHNTGIGFRQSYPNQADMREILIAPGITQRIDFSRIAAVSEPLPNDLGLYEITQDPKDRWKYKTPSLRNVALSAPYMHNGSLATLKEVVEFYNRGGVSNPGLSPLIRPLQLNAIEVDALVAFMQSLTGSNVNELVGDAFTVDIGDVRETQNTYKHQQLGGASR